MPVPRLFVISFLSFFLFLNGLHSSWAKTVSVGVTPDTFEVLSAKLPIKGKNPGVMDRQACPTLDSKLLVDLGRAFAEAVMICNAVFETRLAETIEFIHHLPHSRRLTEIASGRIDVSATTIFPEGLKNVAGKHKPLLSDPVLRINEFEKVLFTIPKRTDVLSIKSLKDLRNFRATKADILRLVVKSLLLTQSGHCRFEAIQQTIGVYGPYFN